MGSIIDGVRAIDNRDIRRRHLRGLLATQMGLSAESLMGATVDVEWRGTRRRAEVIFANVRDTERTPDATFKAGDLLRAGLRSAAHDK